MSNPSEFFECRWQPSRCLLAGYLLLFFLALTSLWLAAIPGWAALLGSLLCVVHAVWVLRKHILLSGTSSFVGLRHSTQGWQLQRIDGHWQPVQLCWESSSWMSR